METVKRTHTKYHSYGCAELSVTKESNAVKLDLLTAVRIAKDIAVANKETDGEIIKLDPETDYFIYEIGVRNPAESIRISVFPIGKYACVYIRTSYYCNGERRKREWLTPEKFDKYNYCFDDSQ